MFLIFILLRVGIEPRHVSIATLQAAALTTQPSLFLISTGIEPALYDLEGRCFTI